MDTYKTLILLSQYVKDLFSLQLAGWQFAELLL